MVGREALGTCLLPTFALMVDTRIHALSVYDGSFVKGAASSSLWGCVWISRLRPTPPNHPT
eukprot:5768432-Amphidinium_carterae.1